MTELKHAKNITAGELYIGMQFKHDSRVKADGTWEDCEQVSTVTNIRVTKSGRIGFTYDNRKDEWSYLPMKPTTILQT